MIEIDSNSDAGLYLAAVMADKETETVRIWPCHDEPNGKNRVKVKRNEGMWTAPLNTFSN